VEHGRGDAEDRHRHQGPCPPDVLAGDAVEAEQGGAGEQRVDPQEHRVAAEPAADGQQAPQQVAELRLDEPGGGDRVERGGGERDAVDAAEHLGVDVDRQRPVVGEPLAGGRVHGRVAEHVDVPGAVTFSRRTGDEQQRRAVERTQPRQRLRAGQPERSGGGDAGGEPERRQAYRHEGEPGEQGGQQQRQRLQPRERQRAGGTWRPRP
jgi:hypothetical protein